MLAIAFLERTIDTTTWSPLTATLVTAAPVAIVTVVAISLWRYGQGRVVPIVILAAFAVHPPSGLPIAALMTGLPPISELRSRSVLITSAVLAVAAASVWALTPACGAVGRATPGEIAGDILLILRVAVGVIVGLLAVWEILSAPQDPAVRRAMIVLGLAILATVIWPEFDRRLTLIPAVVACWWLALGAAVRVVNQAGSRASRAVTMIILLLVPIIQVTSLRASAPDVSQDPRPNALTIFAALDTTSSPATLISTDAAVAPVIAAWRARERVGHAPLAVLGSNASRVSDTSRTRSVYAFLNEARVFSQRGFLVAPTRPPSGVRDPVLWRVFDHVPCQRLRRAWQDVSDLVNKGPLNAQAAPTARGFHTIVYGLVAPGSRPPAPQAWPAGWPRDAVSGPQFHEFDLTRQEDREALGVVAPVDGADAAFWSNHQGIVFRILLQHRDASPVTLSLPDRVTRLIAKIEWRADSRAAVELCPSTWSQVVVGYREAPESVRLEMRGTGWIGQGWHDPEEEGGTIYRWTSQPRAEVRFFAVARFLMEVQLELMPISGSANDQVVASLNGTAGTRDSGPARVWRFKRETVHVGLNVLTLDAPVVPPPPGDTRTLGLKVHSIELRQR